MARRGEELNTRLTATDDASRVVDKVATKLGELEDKDHEARLTADDQASDEIKGVDGLLDRLTAEERKFVLEAEARQAQREVDGLLRKLARVDTYDGDEVEMILDAKDKASAKLDDIKAKLGELEDEADRTGKGISDKLSERLSGLGGQFSGIGGKLAGKLAAGFAAVGVGALMAESLSRSWENAGGLRRVTAQFALTEQEAARTGRVAGKLYADNWGESMPQVQQVVARTMRQVGDLSEAELLELSAQIIAVGDTWEQDYDSVIRSISQMLENDLVGSAQEALDLIVVAFQGGADEAGDLMDTIHEYSQQIAQFGLTGEDAVALMIAAMQNGQRDVDKVADTVKEAFLRMSSDAEPVRRALKDLGFDADEFQSKIRQGGPVAREAFLEVIAAITDTTTETGNTTLAVELMGTQFEDSTASILPALGAIETGLGDVEGAAKDVAEQVGKVSPWQDFRREGETALGTIGDLIGKGLTPQLEGWNRDIEGLKGWLDFSDDIIIPTKPVEDMVGAIGDWRDALETDLVEAHQAAEEAAKDHGDEEAENDRAMTFAEIAADRLERAIDEKRGAEIEARLEAEKHRLEVAATRAEYDLLTGRLSNEQAWLTLRDQFDQTEAKFAEAAEAMKEDGADVEALIRDQEQAMIDLKLEVGRYLTQVLELPPERATEIISQMDWSSLESVERDLEWVTRGRTVSVVGRWDGMLGSPQWVTQGIGTQIIRRAHGGVSPGGLTLVGEQGPELVNLPRDTRVHTAHETAGMLNGTTINLTVNAGMGTDGTQVGRRVVEALETYYRSGGRPPRTAV